MKAALLKLEQRIDALPLPQRAALFAAGIMLVAGVAWFGKFGPMLAERQSLHAAIQQEQTQVDALDKEIAATLKAYESDPNAAMRRRLAVVQEQARATSEDLLNRKQGMVQPQRIVPLLQQMLAGHPGLKVVGMKTLPVSGLRDGQFDQASAAAQGTAPPPPASQAPAILYRHGVEVVVEGSYADLLGYMATLEKVTPRLIWGSARLSVIKHPQTSLTLTVYTLSLDETWVQL